jgi:hypothetical protein
MKGYRKLPIRERAAMGAVGDGAAVGIDVSDTVTEKTLISSIVVGIGLNDFTAGEGPVGVFVAHSDYTDQEIEEALETSTSWDEGDLVAREKANRKVRLLGMAQIEDDGEEVLFDGRQRKFKLNWILEAASTLQFGVYAQGGALTSGGQLDILGHANGWSR